MRFGPAGVPIRCEERSSYAGIKCAKDLGLDAFEMEFVQGCRMKPENAAECGELAKKLEVSLSCHASYYLNFLSHEKAKLAKSHKEIIATAKVMDAAGGGRIAFHSAFYQGMPVDKAYGKVKSEFKQLLSDMKKEGYNATLAPETTGKPTQFGSVEELYRLAEEIGYDKLRPTIDWAHIHARENGRIKGKQDYADVLELVEKRVGNEGLKTLHCHMASINFTAKGERNHLTMDHDIPPFKPLAEALHEFKCDGTIISESPNIEADALYMKKVFERIEKV
jgi:deoxyribonuclease-4